MKKRQTRRFPWFIAGAPKRSSRKSLRGSRGLRCESLEDRMLLAADLQVRFAFLNQFDAPIGAIEVGNDFVLQAYVKDLRATALGVNRAYFDVSFGSTLAAVRSGGAVSQGSSYGTTNPSTNLLGTAGLLDEVGAEDGDHVAPSPGNGELLLFSVPMKATRSGTLDLTAQAAALADAFQLFTSTAGSYESVPFSQVEFTGPDLVITGQVSTVTASMTEDVNYTFSVQDFDSSYINPDHTLEKIKITKLPLRGKLKLGGVDVALGDEIPRASVGNLVYDPDQDSDTIDTFSWNGSDATRYAVEDAIVVMFITPVQDKPTVADFTKTITQVAPVSFVADDFDNRFTDPDTGDTLQRVKITQAPAHGTLKLGDTTLSVGSEILYGSLLQLQYQFNTGQTGSDTFRWTGSDGSDYAVQDAAVNIVVQQAAPTLTTLTATVNEDAVLALDAAAFGAHFLDANGDSLQKVKILSLPQHGTLKLNNVSVSVDQEIPAGDLASLTYQGNADFNGSDSFTWNATDGSNYALEGAAAQIDVSAVADSPRVGNSTKTTNEEVAITFDAAFFSTAPTYSDPEGQALVKIKITALPNAQHGKLVLDTTDVALDQEIELAQLGLLRYVPVANATGSDSFQWKASDGGPYSDTAATVAITINPVNDPPTLTAFDASVASGSTFTFAYDTHFKDHFSDIDSVDGPQALKITQLPQHGILKLGATVLTTESIATLVISRNEMGTLNYTPSGTYTGPDSFQWNASDGTVYAGAAASANLTVVASNPANDPPSFTKGLDQTVAEDAGAQTVDNWAVNISPGPPDEASQTLTFLVSTTNDALFSVLPAIAANGRLTYTPAPHAFGTATVTVQLKDSGGTQSGGQDTSAAQTFTITVTGINDVPSFTKGADVTVNEDAGAQTLSGWATAISAGPGESSQTLTFLVTTSNDNLFHALPAIDATGKLTFTPAANASGSATVTVRIKDSGGTEGGGLDTSAPQTFTITVNAVADLPSVTNFTKSVNEDAVLAFLATDFTNHYSDPEGQALTTVKIVALPTHGTLKLNNINVTAGQEIPLASLGTLTYQGLQNYTGTDSFQWNASDGSGYATVAASASLTIDPVQDVPTLSDLPLTVAEDATLTFTEAHFNAKFSDPDGQLPAKIKIVTLPTKGTLKFNGANATVGQEINRADIGKLTYTPQANYNGSDTFKWNATDGTSYAAEDKNVNLTVTAVQDLPTLANNLALTVAEDATLSFTADHFKQNFTDIDGDQLVKVKITQLPTNGTLKLGGTAVTLNQEIAVASLGTLTFVGSSNFNGTATFQWNASDGTAYAAAAATATITVTAVQDLPSVTNFSKSVAENGTLSFAAADFTGHFSDPDSGDSLQKIKITSLPAHGTLKKGGTALALNSEINAADLATITYVPTQGYNGEDTFKWTASDATAYSTSESTVTIAVGIDGALSGWVYFDADNDGVRDTAEMGLAGVVIKLSRKDSQGNWVEVSGKSPVMTGSDGSYRFEHLPGGTYEIRQLSQPSNFVDGKDTAGTLNGTVANDRIYDIVLSSNTEGSGYAFGESNLAPKLISKRLFLVHSLPISQMIRNLNATPSVDLNGPGSSGTGSTVSFATGAAAVALASAATVTDTDSPSLGSMTLTLSNRLNGDSEVLAANTSGTTIQASYTGGVLQLSGVSSVSDYQKVLRTVTYQNTATAPTSADRTVLVSAHDGVANSPVASALVRVNPTTTSTLAAQSLAGESDDTSSDSTAGVTRNGSEVVIQGSSGNDSLQFVASPTQNLVIFNGETYEYSTSEVSSFRYDGGGGADTAQLTAAVGAEQAELRARSARLQGSNYTFNVTNVKDIRVDSVGDNAEMKLYDSADDDTLLVQASLAMLYGSDYNATAMGFAKVKAFGTSGGTNRLTQEAADFVFEKEGSWVTE